MGEYGRGWVGWGHSGGFFSGQKQKQKHKQEQRPKFQRPRSRGQTEGHHLAAGVTSQWAARLQVGCDAGCLCFVFFPRTQGAWVV